MNVCRITRLLRFLQLLLSGGGLNATGLARECEVSRRTVFRDIEALREAGLPVEFDTLKDQYRLRGDFSLPPVNLTPAESLTLLVLAFEFGQNGRLPFFDAAQTAATKLEMGFPRSLRVQLRKLRQGIEIRPSQVGNQDSKRHFYNQLVNARLKGNVQRVIYDAGGNDRPLITKLRPYHLVFCRHSWYVIGRSTAHRSLRAFSLNRIKELESLDERFTIPDSFRLETYLRNAWLLNPEPGPDKLVEIRFRPAVARNVAEVQWHKTQELTFENDGSLVFRATVSGLNEIVWWVLAYGDLAEVIKPLELRRSVLQRAKNMVANYESNGTHTAITPRATQAHRHN